MDIGKHTRTVDIFHTTNNGTLAVWATRDGRLSRLVSLTAIGEIERCWIFKDPDMTLRDDDGNEIVDHLTRGVACGSFAEGQMFLAECAALGLIVDCHGYAGKGAGFVPLSNGRRAVGELYEPNRGKRAASDWAIDELKYIRVDLPTEEELRCHINAPSQR